MQTTLLHSCAYSLQLQACHMLVQGDTYDAPEPCPAGASLSELVTCVQQLVDVFVAKGFAIKVCTRARCTSHGQGLCWLRHA